MSGAPAPVARRICPSQLTPASTFAGAAAGAAGFASLLPWAMADSGTTRASIHNERFTGGLRPRLGGELTRLNGEPFNRPHSREVKARSWQEHARSLEVAAPWRPDRDAARQLPWADRLT
jgi:hypothetical protein